MVSHVCDGGLPSKTASLAGYVKDVQKKHPGKNPKNKPLSWLAAQPTLVKGQMNRIMIFRGSFNPPHIGHLNLLTYAFDHGGLDIRAAIVLTTSEQSLATKFRDHDETFKFSREDRGRLWKEDERLPQWVWVYEDSSNEWMEFRRRLKKKTRSAGYELEYVLLFGPDPMLYANESTVDLDDQYRSSDYDKVLVCDVSRQAGSPDKSAELRPLYGFEPWKKLELDEQVLEGEASAEAQDMLAILKIKAPEEYRRAVERGDHTMERSVVTMVKDSEHIWVCHQICNANIQWRFVRANRSAYPQYTEITISSTILRAAMKTEEEDLLVASLRAMALSPELLLSMRSAWDPRLSVAEDREEEGQSPRKKIKLQRNDSSFSEVVVA